MYTYIRVYIYIYTYVYIYIRMYIYIYILSIVSNVSPYNIIKPEWGVEVYLGPYLTLVLEGSGGQRPPRAALPQERPSSHCTGGWMVLGVGLDEYGKFHPHLD
jgi:hypothetical protein